MTITRVRAVKQIIQWAEEAENGNYHDLSAVLTAYATRVSKRTGAENLLIIKSVDEWPAEQNIQELIVDE